MSKKSTAIDMTAMCDVSFLLLTFFILTATAKQPEALAVDTPASTVQAKLPDSDLATITIGEEGKVFFGVTGPDVRKRTLELVAEKYKMQFSKDEIEKFGKLDGFGVPLNELKGLVQLNLPKEIKKGYKKAFPMIRSITN